jgi:rhodanese-related sulfurtransferase
MLIDGRSPEDFAKGHLRGAINIGLAGRYAEFAGSVVRPDTDIVLVTEAGHELEGKNRLARIGFDRVIGYLDHPEQTMFEHRDDVRVASRLTAAAFAQRSAQIDGLQIVDVRNPGETAGGMIPGAINIPVRQLPDRVGELDPAAPTVVYCAGGYRSSVAASLLRQQGFGDVSDIVGGYTAWTESTQNA